MFKATEHILDPSLDDWLPERTLGLSRIIPEGLVPRLFEIAYSEFVSNNELWFLVSLLWSSFFTPAISYNVLRFLNPHHSSLSYEYNQLIG